MNPSIPDIKKFNSAKSPVAQGQTVNPVEGSGREASLASPSLNVANSVLGQRTQVGDPGPYSSVDRGGPDKFQAITPNDKATAAPMDKAPLGTVEQRRGETAESREDGLRAADTNAPDGPSPSVGLSGGHGFVGVIVDEHLAVALDEGQNSSNAWRLHEHMGRGVVEELIGTVIRAERGELR